MVESDRLNKQTKINRKQQQQQQKITKSINFQTATHLDHEILDF